MESKYCSTINKMEREELVQFLKTQTWSDLESSKWLDLINQVAESPDDQINLIVLAAEADESFYANVKTVVEKIKHRMCEELKADDVMVVGCCFHKLALSCSGVDLFIRFEELHGFNRLDHIRNIKKCIQSDFPDAEAFALKSCHPYIAFKFSGLSFTVNLTKTHEPYHDIVIDSFLKLDNKIKQLIMVIGFWIKKCVEITDDARRVSSSTVCFLVLFYFQQKFKVDPICESLVKGKKANGWWAETKDYLKNFDKSFLKEVSVIDLLKDFFKYYSEFDFKTYVICPYIGRMIQKKKIYDPFSLPAAYSLYKSDLVFAGQRTYNSGQFSSKFALQDPFMHRTNMAVDLDAKLVDKLKKGFINASMIFAKNENNNNTVLYELFTSKFE